MFEALVSSIGSAPGSEIGFVEFLRWYALGGHSMGQMFELAGLYKIGNGGMTKLARQILGDFRGDIMMKAVVSEISQIDGEGAQIVLQDGTKVSAKTIVCTIPL